MQTVIHIRLFDERTVSDIEGIGLYTVHVLRSLVNTMDFLYALETAFFLVYKKKHVSFIGCGIRKMFRGTLTWHAASFADAAIV